jgi:hypothetical protein
MVEKRGEPLLLLVPCGLPYAAPANSGWPARSPVRLKPDLIERAEFALGISDRLLTGVHLDGFTAAVFVHAAPRLIWSSVVPLPKSCSALPEMPALLTSTFELAEMPGGGGHDRGPALLFGHVKRFDPSSDQHSTVTPGRD